MLNRKAFPISYQDWQHAIHFQKHTHVQKVAHPFKKYHLRVILVPVARKGRAATLASADKQDCLRRENPQLEGAGWRAISWGSTCIWCCTLWIRSSFLHTFLIETQSAMKCRVCGCSAQQGRKGIPHPVCAEGTYSHAQMFPPMAFWPQI